jgi:hypothetical protein
MTLDTSRFAVREAADLCADGGTVHERTRRTRLLAADGGPPTPGRTS